MARTLLLATVTALRDTRVVYPSCKACQSKLLHYELEHRWRCLRCGRSFENSEVTYRYRIPVTVVEDQTLADVVVFGSCLDPIFGASASQFNSLLDELQCEYSGMMGVSCDEVISSCLEAYFVGTMLLFGFRTSTLYHTITRENNCENGSLVATGKLAAIVASHKGTDNIVAYQVHWSHVDNKQLTVVDFIKRQFQLLVLNDQPSNFPVSSQGSSTGLSNENCHLSYLSSASSLSIGHPELVLSCDETTPNCPLNCKSVAANKSCEFENVSKTQGRFPFQNQATEIGIPESNDLQITDKMQCYALGCNGSVSDLLDSSHEDLPSIELERCHNVASDVNLHSERERLKIDVSQLNTDTTINIINSGFDNIYSPPNLSALQETIEIMPREIDFTAPVKDMSCLDFDETFDCSDDVQMSDIKTKSTSTLPSCENRIEHSSLNKEAGDKRIKSNRRMSIYKETCDEDPVDSDSFLLLACEEYNGTFKNKNQQEQATMKPHMQDSCTDDKAKASKSEHGDMSNNMIPFSEGHFTDSNICGCSNSLDPERADMSDDNSYLLLAENLGSVMAVKEHSHTDQAIHYQANQTDEGHTSVSRACTSQLLDCDPAHVADEFSEMPESEDLEAFLANMEIPVETVSKSSCPHNDSAFRVSDRKEEHCANSVIEMPESEDLDVFLAKLDIDNSFSLTMQTQCAMKSPSKSQYIPEPLHVNFKYTNSIITCKDENVSLNDSLLSSPCRSVPISTINKCCPPKNNTPVADSEDLFASQTQTAAVEENDVLIYHLNLLPQSVPEEMRTISDKITSLAENSTTAYSRSRLSDYQKMFPIERNICFTPRDSGRECSEKLTPIGYCNKNQLQKEQHTTEVILIKDLETDISNKEVSQIESCSYKATRSVENWNTHFSFDESQDLFNDSSISYIANTQDGDMCRSQTHDTSVSPVKETNDTNVRTGNKLPSDERDVVSDVMNSPAPSARSQQCPVMSCLKKGKSEKRKSVHFARNMCTAVSLHHLDKQLSAYKSLPDRHRSKSTQESPTQAYRLYEQNTLDSQSDLFSPGYCSFVGLNGDSVNDSIAQSTPVRLDHRASINITFANSDQRASSNMTDGNIDRCESDSVLSSDSVQCLPPSCSKSSALGFRFFRSQLKPSENIEQTDTTKYTLKTNCCFDIHSDCVHMENSPELFSQKASQTATWTKPGDLSKSRQLLIVSRHDLVKFSSTISPVVQISTNQTRNICLTPDLFDSSGKEYSSALSDDLCKKLFR